MTADQVKGKGFRGALLYNLKKLDEGLARVLDSSFTGVNVNEIMREVALVKMLRPNLQKYFYHTSLNFPPSEDLADEKIKAIALEYLDAMGFGGNQYMIFRHFDADHPHAHILVNRIGYDGGVVSDSRDYARCEQVLRKLEKKHRLTEVISSRMAQERASTKNELEMMQRTGIPSDKIKLQVILKDILTSASRTRLNTSEFVRLLESKGVSVLFNQASTGFVSGISYGYGDIVLKGAALGNGYKWKAIQSVIDYEQERDGPAIRQANDKARRIITERTSKETTQSIRGNQGLVQPGAENAFGGPAPVRSGAELVYPLGTASVGADRGASQPDSNFIKPFRRTVRNPAAAAKVGQQVAYPSIPDSNFSGVLFGDNDTHDSLDQTTLNLQPARRKKKRKRLRL
jgi:hypothetical protein